MKRVVVFILLLLVAVLVTAPLSQAAHRVFAVDVSRAMSETCGEGVDTPIDIAKKRIKAMFDESENKEVGEDIFSLVTFSNKASLVFRSGDEKREFIPTLLRLTADNNEASLSAGLSKALELITETGRTEGSDIIVFTAGSDESSAEILSQLGKISAQGVYLRIHLFEPGEPEDFARLLRDKSDIIRIERFACSSEAFKNICSPDPTADQGRSKENEVDETRSEHFTEIRTIIASYLGMEAEKITPEVDLISDLGVDRLKAFEILAVICEKYNVALPVDDLSRVSAIANYVDTTPVIGNMQSFTASQIQGKNDTSIRRLETSLAPVAADKPAGEYTQEIYYGTNRFATGDKDPDMFFSGKRSKVGKISYGKCVVSIPANHKKGAIESAFLGLKFLEDPKQHIRLKSVEPIDRADFFKLLRSKINPDAKSDGWDNDAVVFIHGFNVKFSEAAKRTAQIAYDFEFTGLPLMFSWPSDGKLYSYMSDREDATWSAAHIDEFLTDVLEKVGPKRVHLVAHSMGNQGLIGALNRIALKRGKIIKPLFATVILAAPDFDAQLFQEQVAPEVIALAKGWTIYTSDNDAALNFSTKINSASRLGLPVTPLLGIDVIDATGVEVTPWSVPEFHSYYATKQTVVEDIVSAIKGVAADLRKLEPRSASGLKYWRLQTGL
ncbi:MAG: alpha/beta fold hydrolase [Proteobacteria bacterium]|nr:alpha/beta fold hydrolase [Pseudomonadota bacterium]MBU1709200.1 alpha/beta fold hydrolase [Pseudomonadota bacterium]